MEYIEFLRTLKPIVKKHDGKVFGKRFESDIKLVLPKAYINSSIGLQYVYEGENRLHIGWNKEPIDATRVCSEIDKMIEHQTESNDKKAQELTKIDDIKAKFKLAKELIEELDELHFEIKNELKKEFDLDFKTYFRG